MVVDTQCMLPAAVANDVSPDLAKLAFCFTARTQKRGGGFIWQNSPQSSSVSEALRIEDELLVVVESESNGAHDSVNLAKNAKMPFFYGRKSLVTALVLTQITCSGLPRDL